METRFLPIPLTLLLACAAALGTAQASTPAGERTATAARTVEVAVGDNFFKPKRLSVVKRTRVHWTWTGQSEHNVTVVSGPVQFASKDQVSGEFARTLRKPGVYRLICTIHGQHMRITVHKPAPKH
jgi:plastocyanin